MIILKLKLTNKSKLQSFLNNQQLLNIRKIMNQIPTIPNVSSIYRQLSTISGFKNQYQKQTFNDQPSQHNQNTFQSSERQNRHQTLMNKFKNSFQENRELLQIFGGNNKNNIINEGGGFYQRNSNNIYQQKPFSQNNYDPNINKFQTNCNQVKQKWRAPKINYRHLQKQQQNKNHQNQDIQEKQIEIKKQKILDQRLQKQFYEDEKYSNKINGSTQFNHNSSAQFNKLNQIKQGLKNQNQNERSQLSYSNQQFSKTKQIQYEDNLQSYFQLCRKNGSQRQINTVNQKRHVEGYQQELKQGQKNQKYIRKDVKKIQGINLQKAMRMLQQ